MQAGHASKGGKAARTSRTHNGSSPDARASGSAKAATGWDGEPAGNPLFMAVGWLRKIGTVRIANFDGRADPDGHELSRSCSPTVLLSALIWLTARVVVV